MKGKLLKIKFLLDKYILGSGGGGDSSEHQIFSIIKPLKLPFSSKILLKFNKNYNIFYN